MDYLFYMTTCFFFLVFVNIPPCSLGSPPRWPPQMLGDHIEVLVRAFLGLDCIGIYYFISIIFHGVIQHVWCFFLEVPRIEELQDPSSSPRREEVGRRTLGAFGGFLLPFFYRARFHSSRHSGSRRIEFSQDYSYENL